MKTTLENIQKNGNKKPEITLNKTMKFNRKPLDANTRKIQRGKVHIIDERCKGCTFCVVYCPKDVLEMSEKFNKKGYHPPYVAKDICVNCHFCEVICPEFAIFSTENGEEKVKE